MMRALPRLLVALLVATSLLGGCSTFKKFTGQRNDTVLPGQREDILSPDQQVIQDPNVASSKKAGKLKVPCDPTIDICPDTPDTSGTIDQEGTGN